MEDSPSEFEPSPSSDSSSDDDSCTIDPNEPQSPDLLAPPRQAKRRAVQRPVRFINDSPRPLAGGSAAGDNGPASRVHAMPGGERRSSLVGPNPAPSSRDGGVPSQGRRPVQAYGVRVQSASGSSASRPPHAAGSLPSGRGVAPSRPSSAGASSSTLRPASSSGQRLPARDERSGHGVEEGSSRRLSDGSTSASFQRASSQGRGTTAVSRQGAPPQGRVLSGSSSVGATGVASFGRIGTASSHQRGGGSVTASSHQRGGGSGHDAEATITGSMTGSEIYTALTVAAVTKVQMSALLGILMSNLAPAHTVSFSCSSFFCGRHRPPSALVCSAFLWRGFCVHG